MTVRGRDDEVETVNKAEWFDSHCHLEDERFAGDLDAVLRRMAEHSVTGCLLVGCDMETSEKIVAMTEASAIQSAKGGRVFPSAPPASVTDGEQAQPGGGFGGNIPGRRIALAVGVHPHEARFFKREDLDRMAEWLALPRVVAVGEIGLDYYYDHSTREQQREAFTAQLDFACARRTPVILHILDAHGDVLPVLKERRDRLAPGVLHCYSGSLESAKQYLNMGFYLSFAGPVTFHNARKLKEVAACCPLDRLLVETDSPYLAPEPMRGKRNEPANVRFVGEKVAELKGISPEALSRAVMENTARLFGW